MARTDLPVLTQRRLNRALLARQLLLEPSSLPIPDALTQVGGLQTQYAPSGYVGLWTRLEGLTRADVGRAIGSRAVVRATAMRGTIHLMAAPDFLAFRASLQEGLDAGLHAILRDRARTIDFRALNKAALAYFRSPHTFEDARTHLVKTFPGGDERALGYAARLSVPLVQVPGKDAWSFPAQADFVSAETWLGKAPAPSRSLDALFLRYLAAYGPATTRDAQAWLGVSGLDAVVEKAVHQVRADEAGGAGDEHAGHGRGLSSVLNVGASEAGGQRSVKSRAQEAGFAKSGARGAKGGFTIPDSGRDVPPADR